jgi:hypothetical protein
VCIYISIYTYNGLAVNLAGLKTDWELIKPSGGVRRGGIRNQLLGNAARNTNGSRGNVSRAHRTQTTSRNWRLTETETAKTGGITAGKC